MAQVAPLLGRPATVLLVPIDGLMVGGPTGNWKCTTRCYLVAYKVYLKAAAAQQAVAQPACNLPRVNCARLAQMQQSQVCTQDRPAPGAQLRLSCRLRLDGNTWFLAN